MNARIAAVFLLCLAAPAFGQGFAGLATDAGGFALPRRGHAFTFPADHGPHPAFRIEWWYLTANLTGPGGHPYGIQWTLFRSALAPETGEGWQTPQIWLGHAGLTTPERQFVAERLARGGIGQAGVTAAPFKAWIDAWAMTGRAPDGADALAALDLSAAGEAFAYDLALTAHGPLVPQGQGGYSVKSSEGQASYYYSQPFYTVEGTLTLPAGEIPVTGRAWLDREWSSQPLSDAQKGWDWISLHFADGAKLMGYRMRETGGSAYTVGTWIDGDGGATPLKEGKLTLTPLDRTTVAGRELPVRWRVELPSRDLDVTLDAVNDAAWMATGVPYWEGPVTISGSRDGTGYLEMTGYD